MALTKGPKDEKQLIGWNMLDDIRGAPFGCPVGPSWGERSRTDFLSELMQLGMSSTQGVSAFINTVFISTIEEFRRTVLGWIPI